MSSFVVVRFADRAKTDPAIAALRRLHAGHAIKFHASALVAKDESGKVSVEEITREGHGGTAGGAFIGGIAGLPAGPVAAAIMATGGAVIGNAADLTAEQDFAEFADDMGDKLPRGGAAIVAEVIDSSVPAFEAEMLALGGTLLPA